jgi:hypothetical protein
MCWIDTIVLLSQPTHTTPRVLLLFNRHSQMFFSYWWGHRSSKDVLIKYCVIRVWLLSFPGRESTTATLGTITSYCRSLAIKIIAMVTADQVLTFTNDPAVLFIKRKSPQGQVTNYLATTALKYGALRQVQLHLQSHSSRVLAVLVAYPSASHVVHKLE